MRDIVIPVFSKEKVKHIVEIFKGFVGTLAESGLRQLEYKNSQRELEKIKDRVF